ncbi:alpha/beta fold hydrolase [Massilia sp. NR 4-1]|uniref:alpha/beta fold hydrolase n=1 Tax=Massilia sp. NR 4-1 TaxID=1678028 RepID=UPI00067BD04D|nr:alpha/beta hydrolase [Massilia sp. NR 4-1]AKU21699.1 alpha/beta hydrolase [Massilia sp. NR 4-1]
MEQRLTVDGIEVVVEGEGAETIVMIHGWPDTLKLWDGQVAALKAHYRCARFTLPGYDLSQPTRSWSLDELMAIFLNIVRQVSPDRKVILMLHDWGCVFGYQFYMRHPQLVSRIVGVDIGDAGSRAHTSTLGWRAKLGILLYQLWLAAAWKIGGSTGDDMTRNMARKMKVSTDPAHIGAAMNYPYHAVWTGGYRDSVPFKPTVPLLFAYGTRKPFMFHSAAWADALNGKPHSKALAFDTGHWVMLGKREEFNAAVLKWLAESAAAD